MPLETDKLICKECGEQVRMSAVLSAPHPFQPGQTVIGCPACKDVGGFHSVCDEPGCWNHTSQGWPSPERGGPYRVTCYDHGFFKKN